LMDIDRSVLEDGGDVIDGGVTSGQDAVLGHFGAEVFHGRAEDDAGSGFAGSSPDDADRVVGGQLNIGSAGKIRGIRESGQAGENEENERTHGVGRESFNEFQKIAIMIVGLTVGQWEG